MPDETRTPAHLVSLEDVMVACQKSLARTQRSAIQAARAAPDLSLADRPTYVIEDLELDLSAGLFVSLKDDQEPNQVLLDFDAPSDVRSRLRFRVESRPREYTDDLRLRLANLDALGRRRPAMELRLWLHGELDDDGNMHEPETGVPVEILFAPVGIPGQPVQTVTQRTDYLGRIEIRVDHQGAVTLNDEPTDTVLPMAQAIYVWAIYDQAGNKPPLRSPVLIVGR